MSQQYTITIAPLAEQHFEALAQLTVRPEQEEFAVPDALALAQQLAPSERPFVMLHNDQLAGFFFVDLNYAALHDFCPDNGAGVRMVMVDRAFQGQGVATQALTQLPQWMQRFYPDIAVLYLTVNCRNPGAYRCYEKCGYQDTGALYSGGPVGPQHIMSCLIR
ncbi:Acetyltransferase (GNAT) family protein [Marinomonas aquimarina]|uniref:Acetyltransferase (GNAT) family protein n=1 Tax=Marinomonas aquimarina TaxID=295068 RepID=A0A1A8TDP6_9GAMM|nr:GNAT family N-acetyltransferase [Marinomonas aquimarina]SBS30478.1 Acetyltransferase (GNAT) family protein [Marinomonas aquimarina]